MVKIILINSSQVFRALEKLHKEILVKLVIHKEVAIYVCKISEL